MAVLAQDGITTGAIYALLALALVLVFSVTRIIFIPLGEFVAFGALTLASLQGNRFPSTVWLLVGAGGLCFATQLFALLRSGPAGNVSWRDVSGAAGKYLLYPAAIFFLAYLCGPLQLPLLLQIVFALGIVVPLGPMLYRIAYKRIESASILVLLIASVGVHFTLLGLGLVMFGAEGYRTDAFVTTQFQLGALSVSGQSLIVIAVAVILVAALYFYFDKTLSGKALRATAVNRLGAQLVGISPAHAGALALTLSSAVGVLCGILMSPLTTVYYDSGFLIALKGFVGAIFGGLASYVFASAGAALVGMLESYSSFWASAYREAIVFTLIIPVLMWRSLHTHHSSDEE